jgi:SAM-dependent methyltransferase
MPAGWQDVLIGVHVPDLNWNKAVWGSTYGWQAGGEEWSETWGSSSSEAQWFGSIFPRLHRFLPARRILEIAPGFGRWTKFLIPACDEFVGVDLSAKCVDACRKIFATAGHAQFISNDGFSLDAVPDGKFDLVFSFDSLVHGEHDVLASYIPQVLRKLSSNGVAFLHHSNLLAYGNTIGAPHGRAMTVSADIVADLVRRADGAVLVQEIINWGCDHLIDCLTLLARRDAYPSAKAVRLKNPLFMAEAALIRNFHDRYNGSAEYSTRNTGVIAAAS